MWSNWQITTLLQFINFKSYTLYILRVHFWLTYGQTNLFCDLFKDMSFMVRLIRGLNVDLKNMFMTGWATLRTMARAEISSFTSYQNIHLTFSMISTIFLETDNFSLIIYFLVAKHQYSFIKRTTLKHQRTNLGDEYQYISYIAKIPSFSVPQYCYDRHICRSFPQRPVKSRRPRTLFTNGLQDHNWILWNVF